MPRQTADTLETIVVTARKRAEPLQDIPLAVTAVSAQTIEEAGLTDLDDLARFTTGLTVAPLFGGDATVPVIRGLSQTIGESNVGFFVDGVYQQSRAAMDALLTNAVARVEVTKGPQSALYGRNTFAGAVNYVLKPPSDEFESAVELTGGSDALIDTRASVSGPIVADTLFYRLGGSYYSRDGYYYNALADEDLDDRRTTAVAGSLEWNPGDAVTVTLRQSYESTDNGDAPIAFVANNAMPFQPAGPAFPPANQIFRGEMQPFDSFAVTPGGFERTNSLTSLAIDWDLGPVTVSSISGYNDLAVERAVDSDYEARSIRFQRSDIEDDEFSQELRVQSNGDGRVRWLAGAYYYDLDSHTVVDNRAVGEAAPFAFALRNIPPLAGFLASLVTTTQETTESWSAFGEVEFDLTERLNLSLSGRLATETKSVRAVDQVVETGVTRTFADEADFDSFTPRVALAYHLSEDAMVYASVARAEKTGGFNVVTVAGAILPEERTYDPETATHYELGLKSYWGGPDLTFNVALFNIDWQDQIVRALGATFATLNANAGETTSRGVELEVAARPLTGLELRGGLAYTDAEYDRYTFGALARLGGDPVLDGTRLQYVSKWTANASIQYRRPIGGDWDWLTRFDASYRSDQSTVQTADATVGDRTIGNLRLGIDNGRYSITAWADNIFDDDTALTGVFLPNPARYYDFVKGAIGAGPVTGFEAFGGLVTSAVPRTYGVTLRMKF
ncbi:MAG TPA: TonB-dependent receptor [Woeseiaceae bacterium]|nr:TonB-dependent receptor [Woeseiaceae bacterium]